MSKHDKEKKPKYMHIDSDEMNTIIKVPTPTPVAPVTIEQEDAELVAKHSGLTY